MVCFRMDGLHAVRRPCSGDARSRSATAQREPGASRAGCDPAARAPSPRNRPVHEPEARTGAGDRATGTRTPAPSRPVRRPAHAGRRSKRDPPQGSLISVRDVAACSSQRRSSGWEDTVAAPSTVRASCAYSAMIYRRSCARAPARAPRSASGEEGAPVNSSAGRGRRHRCLVLTNILTIHHAIGAHIHAQHDSCVSDWNTRLSPLPVTRTVDDRARRYHYTARSCHRGAIRARLHCKQSRSPCSADATNRKYIVGIRQHETRGQLGCFRSSGDRHWPLWRMRPPGRSGRRSACEADRSGGGSHRCRSGARRGSCVVGHDTPHRREFLAASGYVSTALQHLQRFQLSDALAGRPVLGVRRASREHVRDL